MSRVDGRLVSLRSNESGRDYEVTDYDLTGLVTSHSRMVGISLLPKVIKLDTIKLRTWSDEPHIIGRNARVLLMHGVRRRDKWMPRDSGLDQKTSIPGIVHDYEHETGQAIDIIAACAGVGVAKPSQHLEHFSDEEYGEHARLFPLFGGVGTSSVVYTGPRWGMTMHYTTVSADDTNWREWYKHHTAALKISRDFEPESSLILELTDLGSEQIAPVLILKPEREQAPGLRIIEE